MTGDDELLERLRVIAGLIDGPPELVELNARAALSTRLLDHELAELLHDSNASPGVLVRGDDHRLRLLSFQTSSVTVELQLDVVAGLLSLRGQVTGAAGEVEVETTTDRRTTPIDTDGWFVAEHLPAGAVRLRLRAEDGTAVTTSWVSI